MGNLDNDISADGDTIKVDDDSFKVFSEKDPALIDWESVGAEIVIESTGQFYESRRRGETPARHRSKKSSSPRPPKAKT